MGVNYCGEKEEGGPEERTYTNARHMAQQI